jgi:peptidoglycan hydrolase-like amidase
MIHKEPELRVGIVLPQDKYKELTIILEKGQSYNLISERETIKISDERLSFKLVGDSIHVGAKQKSKIWKLIPVDKKPLASKAGLKLKNIKAGRGFHWQKLIDVYLPGHMELIASNNTILVINTILFEDYLACVVTSEMSAACPSAFIESQTIAARSWMLANVERKHKNLGMDVCNDDCCQRYQGSENLTDRVINDAQQTRGLILKYKNNICDTRYSKCCGGIRESFAAIWGGKDKPYLQALPDAPAGFSHPSHPFRSEDDVSNWINDYPNCYCNFEGKLQKYLGNVDDDNNYYRWSVEVTQQELVHLVRHNLQKNIKAIKDLIPLKRGKSGRIIELCISYVDENRKKEDIIVRSEYDIRKILNKSFLYSSCIEINKDTDKSIPNLFKLHGAGWGHGVGLCQIGALSMSLHGQKTETILNHYYLGSKLEKIY